MTTHPRTDRRQRGLAATHPRTDRRQRGLTLIELMIALLISSLLIGLVFAIYVRMSVAYRAQTGISEVQQTLRAARAQIVRDARAAGYLIPNGFEASDVIKDRLGVPITAPPRPRVPPVAVFNNVDDGSTDRLRLFYADGSAMARVIDSTVANTIDVDDVDRFQIDDLVVIVADKNPTTNTNTDLTNPAKLIEYDACVLKITDIDVIGNRLTFDPGAGAPYNDDPAGQCTFGSTNIMDESTSMIYRFAARLYRIDPTRKDLSVLQVSLTGGIGNPDDDPDFQDIGIGFTDFQIAYRAYETATSDGDLDGDGDAKRDWYSGGVAKPDDAEITELSISLAVRTSRDLNVVASARTPAFIDTANVDHNRLGDSDSVTLPDSLNRPQYRGNHIYRYTSVRVDLRNTGVGR